MNQPIYYKSGDTKTDLRYIFMFSASKIKVFVHIILLYDYCVYINTHPCIHLRKIFYVYILNIYKLYEYKYIHVNIFKMYTVCVCI